MVALILLFLTVSAFAQTTVPPGTPVTGGSRVPVLKGSGFAVSRAAVISAAGTLDAAPGTLTNCLHVDATSAPCAETATPGGDVSGALTSLQVIRIQGRAVCSDSPGDTQALVWSVSRSCYVPTNQSGSGGGSGNFVDNEVPAGFLDGSNRVFTLAFTPVAGSEHVHKNGIRQKPTVDYAISGATITFVSAATPTIDDELLADYRR